MRYCSKCEKDTERRADGYCKPCDAKRAKAYRAAHPGCSAERDRRRYEQMSPEQKRAHVAKLTKWGQDNPERLRAWRKNYTKENAERLRDNHRKWVAANPEKQKARVARYHAENPHMAAERSRVRRGAMRNRIPAWADKKAIAAIYLQAREFRDAGIDCEVDHIYPLQGEFVSGLHCEANLQIISCAENRSKQNRYTPV
jgi:hypothetical protein